MNISSEIYLIVTPMLFLLGLLTICLYCKNKQIKISTDYVIGLFVFSIGWIIWVPIIPIVLAISIFIGFCWAIKYLINTLIL